MLSLRGLVPALAAVVVLAPAASEATVVCAPDLDRLVRAAARIVITEVVEVRVAAEAGRHVRPVPITIVTLRVNDTLKGPAALQLEIELAGGRVDGWALEIAGMPRFAVGQRDVLFLHDTPGMLSPIVGLFAGRFRVVGHAVEPAASPAAPVSPLSVFLRTVRAIVAAQRAEKANAPAGEPTLPLLAARQPGLPPPAFLRVALGPSPTLANGCRDWACAAARAVEAAHRRVAGGAAMPSVITAESAAPPGTATLAWGTAVGGRVLDPLTLAAVVREESDDTGNWGRTTIVLNGTRTWNAWEAGGPAGGGTSLDLVAVLAEVLASLAAEGGPIATEDRPAGTADDGAAATRGAREPPARLSPRAAAADACAGGSGAMRNPRLLIFDSVDHARMTAYQVGFFLPRAASPVTIVAMPLTAFLERRAIDLPDSELAAMQRTQVASIASAGLATPLGHVYTYRVRGVWSGGTTAWSAASPPFVRCPQ